MSFNRDWSALGKRLDNWVPPQNSFEPAGAWTLHYARHAFIPEPNGVPGGAQAGTLTLERLTASGSPCLHVTERIAPGFSRPTTTAEIVCASDALLTPQRWSLTVRWQSVPPPPAKLRPGEIDQIRSGHVDGQEIVFKGLRERRLSAPRHWTSSWTLFSIIPLLPFAADSVLNFDLFEELELYKPAQRLAYIGPQTVDLNGQTLALHVFEQTGHGVLPWRWWVDAHHRVVLAAGGRRAYLIDTATKGDTP